MIIYIVQHHNNRSATILSFDMSQGMYIPAVMHLRTTDFFEEKLNMKALE